eukprot:699038-Amphidinium_carterae.1
MLRGSGKPKTLDPWCVVAPLVVGAPGLPAPRDSPRSLASSAPLLLTKELPADLAEGLWCVEKLWPLWCRAAEYALGRCGSALLGLPVGSRGSWAVACCQWAPPTPKHATISVGTYLTTVLRASVIVCSQLLHGHIHFGTVLAITLIASRPAGRSSRCYPPLVCMPAKTK